MTKEQEQRLIANELERVFGPDGLLVTKHKGKARWSQMEMAQAINKGFHTERSMIIEAPTGTGKTLAYLIPMALYLRENPTQRFVISVSTKHLQSQIEHDLKWMSEDFPELKKSAILKGANNYLCLNRLRRAARRPQYNKQVDAELAQLIQRFDDLEKMPHGWREELPIKIIDQTWAQISGEGTCCKMMFGCFRKQAKKEAADANIVVVNSDLLGYNVKFTGKPIPGKDNEDRPILILDEAHTFLGRLTEVESADVSFRSLENAINMLTKDSLAARDDGMKAKVAKITTELDYVRQKMVSGPDGQQVVKPTEPLGVACKDLVRVIRDIKLLAATQKRTVDNPESRDDYEELESRLDFSAATLESYISGRTESYVMLLNRSTSLQGHTAINLELKPFELTEQLESLWDHFKQVNLVSATLIGTSIPETKKTFNAMNWEATNFPSPFAYSKQMRVFLPPRNRSLASPGGIAETVKRMAEVTDGRVMALFTNYKMIEEVAMQLGDWCREREYPLLVQERNISPERIVAQYKSNDRSIILGNQSMGTGVDIRLRGLIITKVPFEQFGPYKNARKDYLTNKGVNVFTEDTLPETIRKWKQWWGRLIRCETQKGILVVLDDGLNEKSWGNEFKKALPQVKATNLDDPQYPFPTRQQFMEWLGIASELPPVPKENEVVID